MTPHGSGSHAESPLILLAETQGEVRRTVHDHLEQTGFRAMPAASAVDVFHALSSAPVGAVVLDAALRGVDGMDLCRDLRERSDVPIILVGADSTEVDRVVALELGADDVMAKPYSPRELAARLRAVLRRARAERVTDLRGRKKVRFDQWLVDFARREVVSADGEAIHLTTAEFTLLGVFVDHARVIIPRRRLMELAGVRDSTSSDRSIDVLVSRLRRKLGGKGRHAPIVTVRGAGYMFSAMVDGH